MINLRVFSYALLLAFFASATLHSGVALAAAATTVDTVAENITASSSRLPGLITGISYLLALLFGVTGILKLKDHVENPTQTPLRVSITRFFAGGALLALPIVLEAAFRSIGTDASFNSTKMDAFTSKLSVITNNHAGTGTDAILNDVMSNIVTGISDLPGLVTGLAYLLGLVSCVVAILKIKEHIENPDRIELREGVIRLLIGGALFALPTIYYAIENTIMGTATGAINSVIAGVTPGDGITISRFAPTVASTCAGATSIGGGGGGAPGTEIGGIGRVVCNFIGATGGSVAFVTALSYLFGLVIGLWALLKIRDHVLNPQQTSVWEGISRLIVSGGLFTLPYLAGVVQATITGGGAFTTDAMFTGWRHTALIQASCASADAIALDMAMACFMRNIMAPAHILFNHFAFVAGLVFIMIGVLRIMKSAQDGARGPGGMGTIMTFLTGGVLISINRLVEFFTATLSTGGNTTQAVLAYTDGMTEPEIRHAEIIVSTILQFMIVVGLISFIRGWFIVRSVAEGNQQASLMAGATHIIGGALAINLGPLLSAIQQTLGITGVGLTLS